MERPVISREFTITDIRKIRAYNYEMTKNMSPEEVRAYFRKGAEKVMQEMQQRKEEKERRKQERRNLI
jgi:hypothetical protein